MGGYTKGPWRLIDNGPHWNNPNITNYKIAWSDAGELVCEHVYEQADARLIASAPEMFETLDHISGLCRALRSGGPDPMDLQELSDALHEAVDMANAAISRATGEGE